MQNANDIDLAIVSAIRKGDEDGAARRIMRHYGARLLAQARVLVGAADAEDVVQDSILALLLKLRADDAGKITEVGPYAIQTVRNRAFHHQKRSWQRLRRRGEEVGDETPAPPSSKLRWNTLDGARIAERLIARLKPKERVVVCFRLENHSFREISEQLGITEGNAFTIACRATKLLNEWYEQEQADTQAGAPGAAAR